MMSPNHNETHIANSVREPERAAPHSLDDALVEFTACHREQAAPERLAPQVLAQMRAARERAFAADAISQTAKYRNAHGETRSGAWSRLWAKVSARWWTSALAGSLATVLLAVGTSPLWLHYLRESVEVATPFMLVNAPQTRELDVSQMLRVNVTREAMLDFGIPVPPERLGEQVKAEMLMGGQGEVLAVRFVEREKKQRWRWQMY